MTVPEATPESCVLFRDMPAEEYEPVRSLMMQATYSQEEVILREGGATQSLWLITKGTCVVFKTRKNGTAQELAQLGPGAVFGEMSFFQAAPHSASVRATSELEVLKLSRANFDKLVRDHPTAAFKITSNIAQILAQRLREMDDWMCELIERPGAAEHREEWREFRSKLYSDLKF